MNPVKSPNNLRERVIDFLKISTPIEQKLQNKFDFESNIFPEKNITTQLSNITNFLNFLVDIVPTGNIYLFGGFLRDLAISGRKDFNSDIDIVVENEWNICSKYLDKIGATKNKFGGYRHVIDKWEIDIWYAPETWAFKNKYIEYQNIYSLLKTTILNWDAILMNWKTKSILLDPEYINNINSKHLDIVFFENPDPVGMLVRVLRQLSKKQVETITPKVVNYLHNCTKYFDFNTVFEREFSSYGNHLIDYYDYIFFKENSFNANLNGKNQLR